IRTDFGRARLQSCRSIGQVTVSGGAAYDPGMKSQTQTADKAPLLTRMFLSLLTAGCNSHENVCPIDGQPPDGIWQRNGQSCEYFHYSIVEKKTHSWWAECPEAGTP